MSTTESITITLHSDGMGEATEADFDAWASYVAERIDERTGLDVTVDQARFGESGEDAGRGDHRETIREALRALWDEFCADASAWPQAATSASLIVRATSVHAPDADGAIEVSIRVSTGALGGASVCGAATMKPRVDGRPGYEACGDSADCWVSGGVLRMIEREAPGGLRDALREIEAVASAAIVAQE